MDVLAAIGRPLSTVEFNAIIALTSSKSEYKSIANTITELLWIQHLLSKFRISSFTLALLWYDSVGAIYMPSNLVFHACTKHIEIDYHFVREQVIRGNLNVCYISYKD